MLEELPSWAPAENLGKKWILILYANTTTFFVYINLLHAHPHKGAREVCGMSPHKNFDAFHFAGMLLKAQYMSDTATLN